MITTLALTFALSAPAPASALAPIPRPEALSPVTPAVAVQDDEEKPDKRDEIKDALKTLKDHVGKRGAEDVEAIEVIKTLREEFPESGPKDRKAIVKGVNACLKSKRKLTKEKLFDNKLHLAAAEALGTMGPESVKDLSGWVDHKSFIKDLDMRRTLILSLGNTRDEDAVDPLVELLTNHQPVVQAASAQALGEFTFLKQKERKAVFKKVLDVITQVKNALDVGQTDPIVQDRYDTIAGPMLTTLQKLSGHDARDPLVFRTWWNKNKKKDWDEGKD